MLKENDLFDAHCHMSFASDAEAFAAWFSRKFAGALSTTVSPTDYRGAHQALAAFTSIKVGVGVHPWWVTQGKLTEEDRALLVPMVEQTRFIGEVGLDFGNNGLMQSVFESDEATKAAQIEVLRTILQACAQDRDGCRIFSFHAVRSADVIMDMLQEYGLLGSNTVIFHWFAGSGPQLKRARDLGCSFSVNKFMLGTKRGRAYAQEIPADRLLVETDLPEEQPVAQQEDAASRHAEDCPSNTNEANETEEQTSYEEMLTAAYKELVELRGSAILSAIAQNVERIFG